MTEDQKDEIRALIREVLAEERPPFGIRAAGRDTIAILSDLGFRDGAAVPPAAQPGFADGGKV